MARMRGWQPLLGGVLLALCLVWAVAALRSAINQAPDAMAAQEAEFEVFVPELPPLGEIGYLEPYANTGGDAAVRMHYAAQYALAPRVIVARVGPEFLIVASGTAQPGDDPRLAAYRRVRTFPNGHSLYRRFP